MPKPSTPDPLKSIVAAAAGGRIGKLTPWNYAYISKGGTYIIATAGTWTDSGRPRDAVAILPGALEGSRVLPLYIGVSPDLIEALRAELDH